MEIIRGHTYLSFNSLFVSCTKDLDLLLPPSLLFDAPVHLVGDDTGDAFVFGVVDATPVGILFILNSFLEIFDVLFLHLFDFFVESHS